MKNTASSGIDEISCKIIKKVIHFIAMPLSYIFNSSLSSGDVPENMQISKIIPLYKKK